MCPVAARRWLGERPGWAWYEPKVFLESLGYVSTVRQAHCFSGMGGVLFFFGLGGRSLAVSNDFASERVYVQYYYGHGRGLGEGRGRAEWVNGTVLAGLLDMWV